MKKLIFSLFALSCMAMLFSQSFSSPESVDYDTPRSRWVVGQNGSGEIHILNGQTMALTGLVTGITSGPHGVECVGDTVFCCDGGYIRGYSLLTGAPVFNLNLSATFLNGLTWDGGNYLYTTDFSGKKIYRVDIANNSFGLITTTIKTPNGIIYDGANNRCVFVTWGSNAPVQQVDLSDSSVTTLLPTSVGNCDGITSTPTGDWYISSWSPSGQLYRIDSGFVSAPVSVMTGLSSPADIRINAAGDSIGIPNAGAANNVVFYVIPGPDTTDTSHHVGVIEPENDGAMVYPNPSSDRVNIILENPVLNGLICLRDANGKMILQRKMNGVIMLLERGSLAAGMYSIEVTDASGKIILSRKVIFTEL